MGLPFRLIAAPFTSMRSPLRALSDEETHELSGSLRKLGFLKYCTPSR